MGKKSWNTPQTERTKTQAKAVISKELHGKSLKDKEKAPTKSQGEKSKSKRKVGHSSKVVEQRSPSPASEETAAREKKGKSKDDRYAKKRDLTKSPANPKRSKLETPSVQNKERTKSKSPSRHADNHTASHNITSARKGMYVG